MATRQYIGARYVPKFYTNSNDGSTQWQPNVVYEPLTYVTLQNGNMYISKKEVPATVGSPAENIAYWLDVGNYNGWVENLQTQIDTINETSIPYLQGEIDNIADVTIPALRDEINALRPLQRFAGKTICIIGDSFSDPAVVSDCWATQFTSLMQTYGATVVNLARGGASFASMKNDMVGGTVVIPVADCYIIFLGLNDWQASNSWGWKTYSSNSVVDGVDWVADVIQATNPNAEKFYISPMKFFGATTINNSKNSLVVYRGYYEREFASRGYSVISGYDVPVLNSNNNAALTTDGLHPNATLGTIMCDYFAKQIANKSTILSPSNMFAIKTYTNTMSSSSTITQQLNPDCTMDVQITDLSFELAADGWRDICDIPNTFDGDYPIYNTNTTYYHQYRTNNGKLQVYFFAASIPTAGTQFKDFLKFRFNQSLSN